MRIVLASHNTGKVAEFQRILGAAVPGVEIVPYGGPAPVEDGVSFAENAVIKARAAARHTGAIALADDSGICVDVMGGAPGIFSARWAGVHGDDDANLRLLLAQLRDVRDDQRGASFHCALALVVPEGAGPAPREQLAEGVWPGSVVREPRGEGGFGYDPIFLPAGGDRVSAELSAAEKNAVSHRARALARLVPLLKAL